jgi:putative ubiquitin-RnfH superfamily antitoxin RatB of RatAB toxin-antitoxin module
MTHSDTVPKAWIEGITVTVCYALPSQTWSVNMRVAKGSTISEAIVQSKFLESFKEFELAALNVGVFGKSAPLSHPLINGDRIEIYRQLTFDPKQSRRRRALHRQKLRNIKKKVPINDVTI